MSKIGVKKVILGYDKIEELQEAKRLGFSDCLFVENPRGNMEKENIRVRSLRKKRGILPSVKRFNTIASERSELT